MNIASNIKAYITPVLTASGLLLIFFKNNSDNPNIPYIIDISNRLNWIPNKGISTNIGKREPITVPKVFIENNNPTRLPNTFKFLT